VPRREYFVANRPRPAVVRAIFNRDVPLLPASPYRGCKPLPQRPASPWERFSIAIRRRGLRAPIAAASRSHGAVGHANGRGELPQGRARPSTLGNPALAFRRATGLNLRNFRDSSPRPPALVAYSVPVGQYGTVPQARSMPCPCRRGRRSRGAGTRVRRSRRRGGFGRCG
jgi:hypothetical protein